MDRRDVLLMALAAAGDAPHTPVQIQKLLFLIDRNIGTRIGGTGLSFKAYDYGPFDSDVYGELRGLVQGGFARAEMTPHGWPLHSLTEEGVRRGTEIAGKLPGTLRQYVADLSSTVRRLTFSELVRAVYKAYPEMKKNSVFRD